MPKFPRNCLPILFLCSFLAATDSTAPNLAEQSKLPKAVLVPKESRLPERSVMAARANRLRDLACFIEQSWFHEWPWLGQARLPTLSEFFQIHFADSPAAYLLSKPPGVAASWTIAIKTDSPSVFENHLQSFAKANFPPRTTLSSQTIAGTRVMRLSSPDQVSRMPLSVESIPSGATEVEMTTVCCCWSKQGWLVVASDLQTARWHLENWHAADSLIQWASEKSVRLPEASVGVVEFESDVKRLFRYESERFGPENTSQTSIRTPQMMLLGSWVTMGSAIDKLRGVCSVSENVVLEWNVDVVTVPEKDRVHFGELLRCRAGVADLPEWVDDSWDGGVSFHWDLERGPSSVRTLLESLVGEGEAERFVARSLGLLPQSSDPLFEAARSAFDGAIDVAWRQQPQSGGFTWVLRLGTHSEQAAERFMSLTEKAIADTESADTPSLVDRSPLLRSLVPKGEKIPSLAQTVVQSYFAANRPIIQNASIWLSNDQETLNTAVTANAEQMQSAHSPPQSRKPVPQSSPSSNAYCVGMLKDVSIFGLASFPGRSFGFPNAGIPGVWESHDPGGIWKPMSTGTDHVGSVDPLVPGSASNSQDVEVNPIVTKISDAFVWRVAPGPTDINITIRRGSPPRRLR